MIDYSEQEAIVADLDRLDAAAKERERVAYRKRLGELRDRVNAEWCGLRSRANFQLYYHRQDGSRERLRTANVLVARAQRKLHWLLVLDAAWNA